MVYSFFRILLVWPIFAVFPTLRVFFFLFSNPTKHLSRNPAVLLLSIIYDFCAIFGRTLAIVIYVALDDF